MNAYAVGMRVLIPTLLLALASPLAAQTRDVPLASAEASRDSEALFRRLDTNGDGYLSPQELTAPAAGQGNWIAVDRNGDGRIGRDEFGLVRNFASAPQTGAAGGTSNPQAQQPKAEGQPSTDGGRP